MVCYYCLRKGHYEYECRLKKKSEDLRKERQQKRKSEAASTTGSGSGDNIANIARALIHKTSASRSKDTSSWYIDSAATDHGYFNLSIQSITAT